MPHVAGSIGAAVVGVVWARDGAPNSSAAASAANAAERMAMFKRSPPDGSARPRSELHVIDRYRPTAERAYRDSHNPRTTSRSCELQRCAVAIGAGLADIARGHRMSAWVEAVVRA